MSTTASASSQKSNGSSELAREMLNLQQGDHLCLFYEKNVAEQMPALIPFIQEGLSKDEQFIYIADDQTVDELADRLGQDGINVGKEIKRGRLKLWTRKEWRQSGELDSDRKSLQVHRFIKEASQASFKGIRFAVEMTWTLGPDISAARLEHWEATINTLFTPDFPGRIVCQYNRSRLSPEVVLAALHTHPTVILGEEVCPNLFYKAPLILKGRSHGNGKHAPSIADQVNWMISQLKRARAAEKAREELVEKRVALAEAERWRHELESRVKKRTVQLQAEIEERKRLESEIARAVEREQLRLGQELHDGLGQELTGIAYMMSALEISLEKVAPPSSREANRLATMLLHVVDQTRNLAKGFYPVELQKRGLAAGLRDIACNIKQSFGVNCSAQSDNTPHPESVRPIAIQLFRIAQEATHNAIKHAQAKQILIELAKVEDNLVLTVKDDGIGLPRNVHESQGMGLRIMQYRARLIGGKLEVRNHNSHGAIISCSVPIEEWAIVPAERKASRKQTGSRRDLAIASRFSGVSSESTP